MENSQVKDPRTHKRKRQGQQKKEKVKVSNAKAYNKWRRTHRVRMGEA